MQLIFESFLGDALVSIGHLVTSLLPKLKQKHNHCFLVAFPIAVTFSSSITVFQLFRMVFRYLSFEIDLEILGKENNEHGSPTIVEISFGFDDSSISKVILNPVTLSNP